MAKKKHKHVPPVPHVGATAKVPRGGGLADDVPRMNFRWAVQDLDWDGSWGWVEATVDDVLRVVVPKLHSFETMTWAAVEGSTGCHFVEIASLCKDAQARLEELHMTEAGRLFSVRINGKTRVWGIRKVARLEILWWDPKHSVCPSHLKHT